MGSMWLDVVFILLLIVANAFFSAAELSIISARKSKIAQLIFSGNHKAVTVEKLQKDPHRFLATVQVGVTVVGSAASVLGGAVADEMLKPILKAVPIAFIQNAASPISLGIAILLVSYFLLVFGELVPKTIGLQYADHISLYVAGIINFLAKAGTMVISLLSFSSKTVLAFMGIKAENKIFITREEVQHIVAEGQETGVFSETEQEFIRNIFDFTHTSVREVMVPRTRITGLDINQTREDMVKTVVDNMFSRYPVYRGSIEDIIGFIHGKDLLARMVTEPNFDIDKIIRPPFFVPEGKKVNDLLKEMQRMRIHMAMVVDEYGGINGLVTTEDLLEELVGEIEDEHDVGEPRTVHKIADGTFIVDALISLKDLEDLLEIKLDENLPYDTLAGLILENLGRFPQKGEKLEWLDFTLTCLEVKKTAIDKVKIKRRV